MLAEFVYRALTAGFYGSVTQSFRRVEPPWQGALSALGLLMVTSHSLEFVIHSLRGTPNLKLSIAASICVTIAATLFDLHAMRMGVLTTDGPSAPFAGDMKQLPGVLLSFVTFGKWKPQAPAKR